MRNGRKRSRHPRSPRTASLKGLPGATTHAGHEHVDLDTMVRVLGEATAAIEALAIPYVLLGGLASALLGRPRCSSDIDILVKAEDARRALDTLARAGFATEETNGHWLFKGSKHGVLVDILFKAKGDIYLDDEMVARATSMSFRGQRVCVIPPEDLVVIKAIVHDEETPRHWYDALGILATASIDWEYLLRRARKGPRRVLSLLLYAESIGLVVPPDLLRRLAGQVFVTLEGAHLDG
jgi:hypothetical protein